MHRRLTSMMTLLAGSLFAMPGHADELDGIGALSQPQFRLLAEDIAAVLSWKGLQPPEPLGAIGFDIALDASATRIANARSWEAAGADAGTFTVTRLSATKGLPFGVDAGASLGIAPDSGIRIYGAQLRYAFTEGGVATPAVGLRVAVTRLESVADLAADSRSIDVAISKGFGAMTPYAGYGRAWTNVAPGAATGLREEGSSANRAFAGARFSFVVLQFAVEVERLGEADSLSLRLGFAF